MKQISKQILTMLALLLPLLSPAAAEDGTAVNRAIVTDPLTGVAMDGFDPVSYFTDPEPLEGRGDFEFVWSGVAWHFSSAANREIFSRAPEIYAPQYGGHGAMGVARGYLSRGNPQLYAVFKQRLYFFYSAANREAFLLSPDKAARDGIANWETLGSPSVLE